MSDSSIDVSVFRHDFRQKLPKLISAALATYQRFSAGPTPEDAKSFLAYQTACRAALAHIHLLVKLADCTTPGLDRVEDQDLNELIEVAKAAVQEIQAEDF
ncbi:MAG: hypothetical protein H6905_06795 [Hyphomicrobiales bacterium]|nr:hypothetical protein [Hyphomicrobiales bacterium]